MKKLKFIFLGLFLINGIANAQPPYNNAVGIRAGYSSGLIVKHFVNSDFLIDAIALYNQHGFQVSALYEYQFSPYGPERIQYYFGVGPHSGNWESEFAIGAAAIIGAEFIFRKAPVILGLDWKPMINIYKELDFAIPDVALNFTVILN